MTNNLQQVLEILIQVATLTFSFWPLALFAPLQGRGKLLPQMLVNWIFLLILRIVAAFNPKPPTPLFLTEPLNTGLFVLAGGILVSIWLIRRQRNRVLFQKKVGAINKLNDFIELSPREFEDAIVELYKQAGHDAKRTGAVGDHGVDVVVNAKNNEKWVIQCKRWRGGAVGEPIIRDFYGVVQHEKADKGIIFTTARYSKSALQWAKGKPLVLYDGDQLVEIWRKSQESKQHTTSS
jgi:hypothetical protein